MSVLFCNNNSLSAITSIPASITGSALNLISTQTASSSATISFTSGIDSTYKEYIFKFINIHPATDDTHFSFNLSTDTGSNYNVTKTTTYFSPTQREDGSVTEFAYKTNQDLAQSTSFQGFNANDNMGNANDDCLSGYLHLFNPSSTTFVKHFIAVTNHNSQSSPPYMINSFVAGYANTTSAVDAIQFKQSSGNIDSGTIKLYGVS